MSCQFSTQNIFLFLYNLKIGVKCQPVILICNRCVCSFRNICFFLCIFFNNTFSLNSFFFWKFVFLRYFHFLFSFFVAMRSVYLRFLLLFLVEVVRIWCFKLPVVKTDNLNGRFSFSCLDWQSISWSRFICNFLNEM